MEQTNNSEVARWLEQITQQYESAKQGLTGLAQGTARHAFITAKMKRIGEIHEELQHLVGPEQAIQLVAETLADHTGERDR